MLRCLPLVAFFSLVFMAADASAQQCTCALCSMMRDLQAMYESGERPLPTPVPQSEVPAANRSVIPTGDATAGTQVVFLDFDSRTSFTDIQLNLGYTPFEREEIVSRVREDYELFDVQFVLEQPASGDFTTIFMNDGPAFGIAEQIDFRNINRNDNATVNVPFFATPTDYSRVLVTSTVISHELGHILGLRHADAFGPIGSGINSSSFATFGFDYPGPADAGESMFHIMQTDSDNGVPFETFFGEREAVKLSFNERGSVVSETAPDGVNDTPSSAEPVTLSELSVPDTVRAGQFSDGEFTVNAVTVLGALREETEGSTDIADVYAIEAKAGDVLNVEAISGIQQFDADNEPLGRFGDTISPRLAVLDSEGQPLDYFGQDAGNTIGTEGIDSIIIDLPILEDGTYYISIDGRGDSFSDATPEEGDYELFIYTFGVDSGTRATSAGDFNGDGIVDAADFSLFRDTLGQEVPVGTGADGNANGIIDPEDYRYWLGNFGNDGAGAAGVPEPGGMMLLIFAVSGLAVSRRG